MINFLKKNNIGYSINLRDTVSVMFCFHELDDETLEIKMLDIAALGFTFEGLKYLETFLLEYVEKQKELYKKETVKMAKVTICAVCGSIVEQKNKFTVGIYKPKCYDCFYDVCVECMNKIKDFCSDIDANYKKIQDNIPVNDGKKE